MVLITDDAQRTMLTNLAVSSQLGPADIDEAEIKKAKYVYIEGYLFGGEPTRSAALRAIELAKKNGVKVVFTVSDPFLIQYNRDLFLQLIEGPVDLLFCNLDEARTLTGYHDPIECAREIHKHAENVALTLGGDGSILMHEGQVIPIEGVSVKAVDTTGAGDMYAAGILYGITNGLSWKQAGHLASHAAARVVAPDGSPPAESLYEERGRGTGLPGRRLMAVEAGDIGHGSLPSPQATQWPASLNSLAIVRCRGTLGPKEGTRECRFMASVLSDHSRQHAQDFDVL